MIHSIQISQTMSNYFQNVTSELLAEDDINKEILQRLDTLEAAVGWLSKHQQALWTCSQHSRDAGYHSVCITPIPFNHSESWEDIQLLFYGAFHKTLDKDITSIQD